MLIVGFAAQMNQLNAKTVNKNKNWIPEVFVPWASETPHSGKLYTERILNLIII